MNEHTQTQVKENDDSRRKTHRYIRERWVITGKLELKTPAHFGNGEQSDLTDMPLIMDEVDDKRPLLLGTSIAGALRNYLREIERGDGVPLPSRENAAEQKAERRLATTLLFGGYRGDDEGIQSPLIVHDALGRISGLELRDGVAIDAKTRTAADEKKFDIELLAAGSSFDLHFELLIGEPKEGEHAKLSFNEHRTQLLQALATALQGLQDGHITLGARKRRGYGECTAHSWEVQRYNLTTGEGLLAWLTSERDETWKEWQAAPAKVKSTIIEALQEIDATISKPTEEDHRQRATLTATFALDGSLLIRSGFGESDTGPDTVHLHSWRVDQRKAVPILPGTSWAGVLRHRANQIVRTLANKNEKAQKQALDFVNRIFGPAEIKRNDRHTWASRLSVKEKEITGHHSLVQTRVKIDRFTGGAFESALFSEEPLFGKENTEVTLELTLRPPYPRNQEQEKAEVGLLLLLLKDLWTGDLPVGGESGVGRGRLVGKEAKLNFQNNNWTITKAGEAGLSVTGTGARTELEDFVKAFNDSMKASNKEMVQS
ncbi:hypothetical protein DCC62_00910 [candidate division KSB1 bacterium]|nr:MAG: hypothetical protein DCC62_00910 [candidate division KSB1 bacterium]